MSMPSVASGNVWVSWPRTCVTRLAPTRRVVMGHPGIARMLHMRSLTRSETCRYRRAFYWRSSLPDRGWVESGSPAVGIARPCYLHLLALPLHLWQK
jgi:hypothetical protein